MRAHDVPVQISHQTGGGEAALIFVHGFGGKASETWGRFPEFMGADPRFKKWGVFSLGFSSSIRVDVPGLWSANAGLDVLALQLKTALELAPFDRCKAMAIAAHSMGGLIVQRAILDSAGTRRRLSHLFLFGTPSAGLKKAWFGALLNRQLKDMREGGKFIRQLRGDWAKRFAGGTPFLFRVIGGERDEFVPAKSSILPFADAVRAVVPGNHIDIVKPDTADHRSVEIVKTGLIKNSSNRQAYDSVRLAVEMRDFQNVVGQLLPHATELSDASLVSLALALDGVGRGAEALRVLEEHYRKNGTSSTDALGVLGGRYKRAWLAGRRETDLRRARELYSKGLAEAEINKDRDQAYYQAINLAFLDLMAAPATTKVPKSARDMADRALRHCKKAGDSHWRRATQAEAALILGNLPRARKYYREALAMASSERERDSIYSQAVRVAAKIFGEPGVKEIATLSGFG